MQDALRYTKVSKGHDGRSLNAKTSRLAAISTLSVGQAIGHLPRNNDVQVCFYLQEIDVHHNKCLKFNVGLLLKRTKLTLWPTHCSDLARRITLQNASLTTRQNASLTTRPNNPIF